MSVFNRETALWGSIYLAILVSLLSLLGAISVLFIMLPLTVLYVRQSSNVFFIVYAVALAIALAFAGGAGFALTAVSVFFLIASGMMGHQYKAGASAAAAIATGTITLLAESLLLFLGASLYGVNIPGLFRSVIQESLTMMNTYAANTMTTEFMQKTADMMVNMIPVFLITTSVMFAVVTHWLARRALIRYGMPIKGLPPIKEWMLPKSLVWYYLLALGAQLFIPATSSSIWSIILLNLLPLLIFAFAVQGVSFLFFFAAAKGWGYALPAAGIVLAFLFSYPISMLGLIDIAFNLRKRMKNQN